MTDTQILTQLLNGEHLSKTELLRAQELIRLLKIEADNRKF